MLRLVSNPRRTTLSCNDWEGHAINLDRTLDADSLSLRDQQASLGKNLCKMRTSFRRSRGYSRFDAVAGQPAHGHTVRSWT
jgi:hypothetical protein